MDATEADPTAKPKWTHPSVGRWALFAAIAIGVVVVDQLVKAWVVGNLAIGERLPADRRPRPDRPLAQLRDPVRDAPAVGRSVRDRVARSWSGLIVFYHAKAGRGLLVTIALGLLLGGAHRQPARPPALRLRRRLRRHGHRHLAVLHVQRRRCGDLDGDRAAGRRWRCSRRSGTGRRMTEAGGPIDRRAARGGRARRRRGPRGPASSPSRCSRPSPRPAAAQGPRGRGRPPRRPVRRRPDGPVAVVRPEADQRRAARRRRGARSCAPTPRSAAAA